MLLVVEIFVLFLPENVVDTLYFVIHTPTICYIIQSNKLKLYNKNDSGSANNKKERVNNIFLFINANLVYLIFLHITKDL
mgnify:CR=1 FL=1